MGTYQATHQDPETGHETSIAAPSRKQALEALRLILRDEWSREFHEDEVDDRILDAWWDDAWSAFRLIRIEQIA